VRKNSPEIAFLQFKIGFLRKEGPHAYKYRKF